MQLKPGRWTSFVATQEGAVERVEFSWRARFRVAPLISMKVVDWYRAGGGGLTARLWGLIPMMRGGGPEFAKGEAMRYLAELPWNPFAFVANRQLGWRELDEQAVDASTRVGAAAVAVRLHFDADGDIVGSSADSRPRMVGKRTIDTPFSGRFADYREIGGVRVPTRAVVAWELPEGPFPYFRGRITDLELG